MGESEQVVREMIPSEAYREGSLSYVDLYPKRGRNLHSTHQIFGVGGLGVAPAVVGGTVAAGAAIGGLLALVQNAMSDDWSDREVFSSHARDIHSAMLSIQCLLGGAATGQPLVDTLGQTICPGGTKPVCAVPNGVLSEWRTLRDGFSRFWGEVSDAWGNPSSAEARRLKEYAQQFYTFYLKIAQYCQQQGISLPPPVDELRKLPAEPDNTPGWLKWTVAGVGVVAAVVVVRTFWGR